MGLNHGNEEGEGGGEETCKLLQDGSSWWCLFGHWFLSGRLRHLCQIHTFIKCFIKSCSERKGVKGNASCLTRPKPPVLLPHLRGQGV